MIELLSFLFSYPTAIYSVLLCACLVFWSTVLIGAMDMDAIDLDIDLDAEMEIETEGVFTSFAGLLSALGVAGVPVTVVLSFIIFWGWLITALVHNFFLISMDFGVLKIVLGGVLILLATVVALFAAAFSAYPLKGVFVQQGRARTNTDIVGHAGEVTSAEVDSKWGQVRLKHNGHDLDLTVRTESKGVKKGDTVIIVEYIEADNIYHVEPYPVTE